MSTTGAASYDVAVLGAGPAGLFAAWRLALAGRRVLVLDRGDRVGGMAASFDVDGVRVDLGSHRLHGSTSPRVLAALRQLLGDDLQERKRNGRIALGCRFVTFPLQLGDLLRNLPPSLAASMAMDAVVAPLRRARADTFAEVIRVSLGPTVLSSFYGPYARKLWDADARELSGELARRRVSAGSAVDVLRRVVANDGSAKKQFFYPRRGFGQIVEALEAAALAAGAVIERRVAVDTLEVTDARTLVGAGDRSWTARIVLSTLPIEVLARLLDDRGSHLPRPPSPSGSLRHRALRLVYLSLETDQYTPFDAHYLPSVDTVGSRLSEPKNYRDGDDPPGRTVLCVEVPCTVGDGLWTRHPEALGDQLAVELEAMGLPRITPSAVRTVGLPHVYPVYRVGFEHHLQDVEDWIEAHPAVVAFGRAGLFTPDNTHHALEMGWEVADCVRPDGSFDRASWQRARERFRANVVED